MLERGRVAKRWRSERWESLRLLSPNWQTRLPHSRTRSRSRRLHGPPQGGRLPLSLADSFQCTGRTSDLRETGGASKRQLRHQHGSRNLDRSGLWRLRRDTATSPRCPHGPLGSSPPFSRSRPRDYVNPSGVAPGGVLVVGASATGIQLAHELRQDGRRVVIAVGRHMRIPRTYRGRDIMWWLDRIGVLADMADSVFDRAHVAGAAVVSTRRTSGSRVAVARGPAGRRSRGLLAG